MDDRHRSIRTVQLADGTAVRVLPLRRGDVGTVRTVFERLGHDSRRRRFLVAKPSLGAKELRWLAAVDERHHALVGYVGGDPRPAAIARLVRHGPHAEIAFEVADEHQGRGVGSVLARELVADARAAGITEITALVSSDNGAALALLRRALRTLEIGWEGRDLLVRAPVPC